MPRRKLSEFRSKQIVTSALGVEHQGWDIADNLNDDNRYVVKVDQAVKKRFKNGLVGLNLFAHEVREWIEQTRAKGYEHFIIEPYQEHDQAEERYLNLTRDGYGLHLTVSAKGGVDIEDNTDSLEGFLIDDTTNWDTLADKSALSVEQLQALIEVFNKGFMTLLEINPYLVHDGVVTPLDVAIEVDDTATLLVDNWKESDLRSAPRQLSEEERTIAELNENSPASLAFQLINPDGSLFVLLSGGGASVTVCDEIYSAGYGDRLANYGEYSGNPTEEETYIYTSAVLETVLRSSAPKKAMLIGGAVANFTDVAKTFAGIIKAINEHGDALREQGIKIVVRRGGPNQEVGLKKIKDCLDKYGLSADVFDPKTSLGDAVKRLIQEVA
jgi:ATP-citrate lyase beta-subunit